MNEYQYSEYLERTFAKIVNNEELWQAFLKGEDSHIFNRAQHLYAEAGYAAFPMHTGKSKTRREQTLIQYVWAYDTLTGEQWRFWNAC